MSISSRNLLRAKLEIGKRDVKSNTTDGQTSSGKIVRYSVSLVKIDLRVEGVSQDAISQDEEKMTKYQKVGNVENWIMHKIHK